MTRPVDVPPRTKVAGNLRVKRTASDTVGGGAEVLNMRCRDARVVLEMVDFIRTIVPRKQVLRIHDTTRSSLPDK